MPNNKITKIKSIEGIRKSVGNSVIDFDSSYIPKRADKKIKVIKNPKEFSPSQIIIKL